MPDRPPVVSVIIPTYRHAEYVGRALDSVFAQTFREYEVIVVNDGSPDDTAQVLAPLVQEGRITTYIEQKNAGQASARNRGIAAAQGEFIALLDDDDWWPAEKLAWQVEALRADPACAVVYGIPLPVDEKGESTVPQDGYGNRMDWPASGPSGAVYEQMLSRCWLISPGQALVRRSALAGDRNIFDPQLRGCDDWDLWLRIAERGSTFRFEPRDALYYRLHGGNASRDTLGMRQNELRLLLKHLGRNYVTPKRALAILARLLRYLRETPPLLAEQAQADLVQGHVLAAREKLRYCRKLRPYLILRPWFQKLWRTAWTAPVEGAVAS